MRTIIIILSTVVIIFGTIPQRTYAQASATATVTATVIPSISFEIKKSNVLITKEKGAPLTIYFRGTDNILVVVESKEVKSVNVLQLTIKKTAEVILPSSLQSSKITIAYMSS